MDDGFLPSAVVGALQGFSLQPAKCSLLTRLATLSVNHGETGRQALLDAGAMILHLLHVGFGSTRAQIT